MTSRKKAAGACAVLGLISTWDTPPARAASFTISGSITPTNNLSDVYFIFSTGACNGFYGSEIASFAPANVQTDFSFTLTNTPDYIVDPTESTPYTILGLYDVPNGGVAVAYNNDQATGLFAQNPAPQWGDSPFIPGIGADGLYYQYIGITEPDAAADLQNGAFNGYAVPATIAQYSLAPTMNESFTFVDYSGASFGGTGSVTTIPLPATGPMAAAAVAGLAVWTIRRRRKPLES